VIPKAGAGIPIGGVQPPFVSGWSDLDATGPTKNGDAASSSIKTSSDKCSLVFGIKRVSDDSLSLIGVGRFVRQALESIANGVPVCPRQESGP
jgi:hypothetical protein